MRNGYRGLGRQLLLLPVEWTAGRMVSCEPEIAADSRIPMPIAGSRQQGYFDPSDTFETPELGLQWGLLAWIRSGTLLDGEGRAAAECAGQVAGGYVGVDDSGGRHSYTVEVDVEVETGCEGGLLLFYNPEHAAGMMLGPEG